MNKNKLRWKRAEQGYQKTHCGKYWVEQDPEGGHFNKWHAHRSDMDEQLTFNGFSTREEAKTYCERDFQNETKIECSECLELFLKEDIDENGVCHECSKEECPTCEGTGTNPDASSEEFDDTDCYDCGGDGRI